MCVAPPCAAVAFSCHVALCSSSSAPSALASRGCRRQVLSGSAQPVDATCTVAMRMCAQSPQSVCKPWERQSEQSLTLTAGRLNRTARGAVCALARPMHQRHHACSQIQRPKLNNQVQLEQSNTNGKRAAAYAWRLQGAHICTHGTYQSAHRILVWAPARERTAAAHELSADRDGLHAHKFSVPSHLASERASHG